MNLQEIIPPDRYYSLHINLIRHDREICVAGVPRCGVRPLTEVCEYYWNTHLETIIRVRQFVQTFQKPTRHD